jgi:hypothetical protein
MSKGFVVVASNKKFFYLSAINLIESIKYFYPEAHVTLYTQEEFLDGQEECADNVEFIQEHTRAKLDGMARSPYDQTFYIDADCEVEHEDIATVFDHLGDNDLVFTGLPADRHYCYAEVFFPGATKEDGTPGGFELCGGVCLYNMANPLVKEFMRDWYDLTVKQYSGEWWPRKADGSEDLENYPASFKRWDQFSLWWLVNREPKYKDLKVAIFEDDARWNFFNGYRYPHNEKPVVIRHFSNVKAKRDAYD